MVDRREGVSYWCAFLFTAQKQNNMYTIGEIMDLLDEFIEEGNAVLIDGKWSTQCAQYTNRLTKAELVKYFIKEYYPEYNDNNNY